VSYARRGNLVWLSMVLSGLALAAFVWISWPESSFRLVRLPYGESMPKSSPVSPERQQPVRTVAAVAPASQPEVVPAPELAAAEPEPLTEGPAPVGSDLEEDGYAESPESLGAEPLPGFGGTAPAREDQPVAEAAPAPPAPADEPDEADEPEDEPVLDVVIGLPPPPPHAEP